MQLYFDTPRLVCRSIVKRDFPTFVELVTTDKEVQKYFQFGDVFNFLENLPNQECYPFGIFSKSTNALIGYINGYVYTSHELLVEYFISGFSRCNHYAFEVLPAFFNFCRDKGFTSFRFEVEEDNIPSISLLTKIDAEHCDSEDYMYDAEAPVRNFKVYKFSFR